VTPETLEDRLEALRKERVSRFSEGLGKAPALLYHYTRMSTLEQILKHGSVWATEGHFLNDTAELRYAAGVTASYIRTRWPESRGGLAEAVATAIENDQENRPYLMFIASFSREDDLLSQWRAYADDGAGVAVGFDLTGFADVRFAEGLSGVSILRCIYKDAEHEQAMLECIAPQLELGLAEGVTSTAVVPTAQSLLVTVGELGVIMKNPGFREEREWRLVLGAAAPSASQAIEFRNTKWGPAPFVRVPLGAPIPLREIVLGPRTEKVAERSIRLMLEQRQLDARVRRSKVSYR
jgi:hypothetical protein